MTQHFVSDANISAPASKHSGLLQAAAPAGSTQTQMKWTHAGTEEQTHKKTFLIVAQRGRSRMGLRTKLRTQTQTTTSRVNMGWIKYTQLKALTQRIKTQEKTLQATTRVSSDQNSPRLSGENQNASVTHETETNRSKVQTANGPPGKSTSSKSNKLEQRSQTGEQDPHPRPDIRKIPNNVKAEAGRLHPLVDRWLEMADRCGSPVSTKGCWCHLGGGRRTTPHTNSQPRSYGSEQSGLCLLSPQVPDQGSRAPHWARWGLQSSRCVSYQVDVVSPWSGQHQGVPGLSPQQQTDGLSLPKTTQESRKVWLLFFSSRSFSITNDQVHLHNCTIFGLAQSLVGQICWF